MEIKEQIGKELLEYARWYRDSCIFKDSKLAMSIDLKNRAEKIVKIFEQAGYLPIQAGEDGLVDKAELCWNICNAIYEDCDMKDNCLDLQNAIKATEQQKALDKQKQAEAVKKVFDEIIGWVETKLGIFIEMHYLEEWESFKQTLEELEK